MKYVNSIFKFRHVHHPKYTIRLLNADLFGAWPYIFKRLPVIRIFAALHFAQLVTRCPPRILGKNFVIAQILKR